MSSRVRQSTEKSKRILKILLPGSCLKLMEKTIKLGGHPTPCNGASKEQSDAPVFLVVLRLCWEEEKSICQFTRAPGNFIVQDVLRLVTNSPSDFDNSNM